MIDALPGPAVDGRAFGKTMVEAFQSEGKLSTADRIHMRNGGGRLTRNAVEPRSRARSNARTSVHSISGKGRTTVRSRRTAKAAGHTGWRMPR